MDVEQPFEIGEFTLDPTRLTASGPHGEVHLGPKIMAVAAYLADRVGHVVPREAMIRDIWGGYPGADQSLSNAVSCLRRTLQDSAREPRLIQTIPKRGYRLLDTATRIAGRHGVAVLPFRNIGADAENEYLCEGLAEELLNALARVPELRVTARATAFAVARRELSVADVGRRLDVDHAFEGGVQRVAGRLRISVRLLETHSETQIWARDFRTEWANLFEIQDSIARAAIQELKRHLELPTAPPPLDASLAVDPEAYVCFLKGRYFWYRDNIDPGKALEYFHKAIELAPGYAARAMSLDPDAADANFSNGYSQFYMAWDCIGAEAAFRKALDRNPEHILALCFLADVLVVQGRDAEAWEVVQRLLRLDPISAWCHFIASGMAYWMRDFDTAAEWAQEGLNLEPGYPMCLWVAAAATAASGHVDKAMPLARQLEQRAGKVDLLLGYAAAVYAICGVRDAAQKILGEFRRRDRARNVSPVALSLALTPLGHEEEAISALRAAYDGRNTPLFNISRDPVFDPIRHRWDFQEILLEAGFPIVGRGAGPATSARPRSA
jgi:serine/threonine-protein kinase